MLGEGELETLASTEQDAQECERLEYLAAAVRRGRHRFETLLLEWQAD